MPACAETEEKERPCSRSVVKGSAAMEHLLAHHRSHQSKMAFRKTWKGAQARHRAHPEDLLYPKQWHFHPNRVGQPDLKTNPLLEGARNPSSIVRYLDTKETNQVLEKIIVKTELVHSLCSCDILVEEKGEQKICSLDSSALKNNTRQDIKAQEGFTNRITAHSLLHVPETVVAMTHPCLQGPHFLLLQK